MSKHSKRKKKASEEKPAPVASPTKAFRTRDAKRPWWREDVFVAALLILTLVLAYQPVWQAGFIWDDDSHLTANPAIVGPAGFREIWTTRSATYYPMALVTFWLEHAVWGLAPLPYHLVNVMQHGACALLLWRLLSRLNIRGAWLGAALWALHPVQVESVAWITELKNTQSALFYLLAILFFMKWCDDDLLGGGKTRDYILALLFAVLALLSKSSTVMLPVVLALCAWWRQGHWSWRKMGWLVPFLFISAAVSGWTIWEQKFHSGALGADWSQTWPERIIIAGRDVWFYLGKLAWPHPLIFIYPRWHIDATQWTAYLPTLAVAGALVILWWFRNGPARPVFFALAYFVISLFPVFDFFNVYFFRFSFVADHFQYLASMGPLALAGAGITTVFDSLQKPNRALEPIARGVLLVTLGILTWSQCRMYQDIETLWQTTLPQNPECWMAHDNLGKVLLDQGRLAEAKEQFEEALRIYPNFEKTHNNLGNVLKQMGQLPEAIDQYEQALRIKPDYAEAHYDLGNALQATGRLPEAIEQYQQALRIKPDYIKAHNNLGNALEATGRLSEAIDQYEQALRINPDDVLTHNNMGLALWQTDRKSEAIVQFEQALRVDSQDAETHNNLGYALEQTGQPSGAMEQYEEALRLKPDFAAARDNLARLQAQQKTAPAKN